MTTPMRGQYLALKKQYPDIILLFRMGDFYESFDEDARIVSEVCGVVLTSRPIGSDGRIPLAGVPYHAIDGYLARLIAAGHKVAIAEQIGSEPPRGEKLVRRAVRRIVTPGTLAEPGLLTDDHNNYIAAIKLADGQVGLAYADVSTGEFAAVEIREGASSIARLADELARLQPAELLYPAPVMPVSGAVAALPALLQGTWHGTAYAAWHFDEETAARALMEHFKASTLQGYGCAGKPLATGAAGALINYVREAHQDTVPQLGTLRSYSISDYMALDEATRRNLEITETMRDRTARGALVGILDHTRTPMGGRLLRRWLNQPLTERVELGKRLDAVGYWHDHPAACTAFRQALEQIGDLERWTNRVLQGTAQPRELVGMRSALGALETLPRQVAEAAGTTGDAEQPGLESLSAIDPCADVLRLLRESISEDPPAVLGMPGVIRTGYSPELDALHTRVRDARAWIASLETTERSRTGIRTLKVGYNKVFGYYLEVTAPNAALVPTDYIRRQTLVNAERYVTAELKEFETEILNSRDRVLDLEGALYRAVLELVAVAAHRLLAACNCLGETDVAASLADVARTNDYVRPELSDDLTIEIVDGRHPVVEQFMRGERFASNDVRLTAGQSIMVLTGPNMSGKSTYIRQVAMIVLMAQIGSYVPARSAHIGLVDRIFTRIGASDEIARGQSTFMVEMVETASILNHATARSLLVFDEIGRGTSTYDGLAIAWAVIEHIHNNPHLRSRTLFATHYHELTELAQRLPHVVNYNVVVSELGDQVVFLHRILPGIADRSYGVHVGRLAGLPRAVIARAEEILAELEASGAAGPRRSTAAPGLYQLPLFVAEDPIVADLKALDVNGISPLEALNKLFELQQRLRANDPS